MLRRYRHVGTSEVSFAQVEQRAGSCSCCCGGFDGLAAVVPYGDPDYRAARHIRLQESELTPLDETFGLAPGLSPLRALWDANELAVLHAMAIPHRTRSHFDGQAILETGLDHPVGSSDGWLNRLLQVMSGRRAGIAIAAGMPLSLTVPSRWKAGPQRSSVWSTMRSSRDWRCCIARFALQGRFEAALQQQNLVGQEPMSGGNAARWHHPLMQAARTSSVRSTVRISRPWSSAAGIHMQPGDGRRCVGPFAATARRRARGIPFRDGLRLADHNRRCHD